MPTNGCGLILVCTQYLAGHYCSNWYACTLQLGFATSPFL